MTGCPDVDNPTPIPFRRRRFHPPTQIPGCDAQIT